MIGTNSDLELIRYCLDSEIGVLLQTAGGGPDRDLVSRRLAVLGRRRSAVSATLANRRAEAAKPVVDLSRWFSGNGALDEIKELAIVRGDD